MSVRKVVSGQSGRGEVDVDMVIVMTVSDGAAAMLTCSGGGLVRE